MNIPAYFWEYFPFYGKLNEDEKTLLHHHGEIHVFHKGALLYGHCVDCLGTIALLSGSARVYILSPEGREINLFGLKAKDTCVLSSACMLDLPRFDTLIEAQEGTDVLAIPARIFAQLSESNPHVKCFLYQTMAHRFSQVMDVMKELLFLSLDQRLAKFFLRQAEEKGIVCLHITQDQLAQEINSAREAVARTLHDMEGNGLVEMHRGTIILKDMEGLRSLNS